MSILNDSRLRLHASLAAISKKSGERRILLQIRIDFEMAFDPVHEIVFGAAIVDLECDSDLLKFLLLLGHESAGEHWGGHDGPSQTSNKRTHPVFSSVYASHT